MSSTCISGVRISGIASSVPFPLEKEVTYKSERCLVRRSNFEQTSSDLAFDAALRIINHKEIDVKQIGLLIFVSSTPDYRSPNTAAVLQGRLGLPLDCICYDVNKSNNSFISGIIIGSSILKTINKQYGLILIGDSLSKLTCEDSFFSSIASDAGSAILLESIDDPYFEIKVNNWSFGDYYSSFCIPKGGFRFYDSLNPFDSTKKENFILNFDHDTISALLDDCDDLIRNEFEKDDGDVTVFLRHSLFNEFNGKSSIHNLQLDQIVLNNYGYTGGSNLPLQLSLLLKKRDFKGEIFIKFSSIGEGLELSFLTFLIDPRDVLETQETADVFSDFRVTHEM